MPVCVSCSLVLTVFSCKEGGDKIIGFDQLAVIGNWYLIVDSYG